MLELPDGSLIIFAYSHDGTPDWRRNLGGELAGDVLKLYNGSLKVKTPDSIACWLDAEGNNIEKPSLKRSKAVGAFLHSSGKLIAWDGKGQLFDFVPWEKAFDAGQKPRRFPKNPVRQRVTGLCGLPNGALLSYSDKDSGYAWGPALRLWDPTFSKPRFIAKYSNRVLKFS